MLKRKSCSGQRLHDVMVQYGSISFWKKKEIWFLWFVFVSPCNWIFLMFYTCYPVIFPLNPIGISHLQGFTKFSCNCNIMMGNLLAKTSQKPIQPLPTRDVYICGSHVIWKAENSYHPELHFGSYLIILLLQVTRFWLILDPYISLAAFHHPRIALRLVTPSSRWEASSSGSSRSLPISRGLLLWRIIHNRSITDSDSSRNSQKKD